MPLGVACRMQAEEVLVMTAMFSGGTAIVVGGIVAAVLAAVLIKWQGGE